MNDNIFFVTRDRQSINYIVINHNYNEFRLSLSDALLLSDDMLLTIYEILNTFFDFVDMNQEELNQKIKSLETTLNILKELKLKD